MKMYREMGRSAYYLFSFFIFKFFYVEKVEGSIMNRKGKKFVIIKITQIIIFCISIIAAILYRDISPSWPFYLLLIGVLPTKRGKHTLREFWEEKSRFSLPKESSAFSIIE